MLTIQCLFESNSGTKPVKVVTRMEPKQDWICPHCDKKIGEKAMYYDQKNDTWHHRDCQGPIKLPETKYKESDLTPIGKQILKLSKKKKS